VLAIGVGVGSAVGVEVGGGAVGAAVGVAGGGVAQRVAAAFTAPRLFTSLPVTVFPFRAGSGEPVESRMFFKEDAERGVEHIALAKAATPATCGHAIEVPLKDA
jgi:hypothetical protein